MYRQVCAIWITLGKGNGSCGNRICRDGLNWYSKESGASPKPQTRAVFVKLIVPQATANGR
jgi:hypothetical protein